MVNEIMVSWHNSIVIVSDITVPQLLAKIYAIPNE